MILRQQHMGVRNIVLTVSLAAMLTVTAVPGYSFSLNQLLGNGEGQNLDTFKLIHVADLKALLAKLGDKVHVFDVNGPETREQFGTIPSATLLASDESYPLSVLPASKHATLVFYCANLH